MNWFKGSVREAISSAKSCCGIFVVFIYDKSDLSKTTREKLEDKKVYEHLSSSKCVAIEIENGSTDAIQFAQIYPLIIVPSLFFISPENGIPLEIIGGHFEVNALVEKLQKVLSLLPAASATAENIEGALAEEVLSQNAEDVKPIQTSEPEKNQPISTDTNEAVPQPAKDDSADTSAKENLAPLEERVQRARELINERAEAKAQEQMEEEKRKELERRQQLQELAKAKEKREELERSELSRQRKKDKEEARIARERVRAQIAADKAERLARESLLKGESPAPPTSPPIPDPEATSRVLTSASCEKASGGAMTRIKFRFPDNSSNSAQFSPDATLSEVKSHLIDNCNLSSRFRLVATLPPRSFTDDQMPLTLSELGLTPSAIIIVKPFQGTSPSSLVPSGEGIMSFIWSLLSPLAFLVNYLKGVLGLGPAPAASNDSDDDARLSSSSKRPRTEGSYTTRNRPKTAYGRRGERDSFTRREGNVYRFDRPENDEDDDDNNTWNGNSTQQM